MSEDSLVSALAKVQKALPEVKKDQTGQFDAKYATLAAITKKTLKLLGENGLAWMTFPTILDDGRFVLYYKLAHTSGDTEEGWYPLPNGTPQQIGSAITYARRYSLCSVVGIAPEDDPGDDDGQQASQLRPQRIEPTKDMIRKMVDQIYMAKDRGELRRIWAGIAGSGMQDAETIDHEGNPASLRELVSRRGPELPEVDDAES